MSKQSDKSPRLTDSLRTNALVELDAVPEQCDRAMEQAARLVVHLSALLRRPLVQTLKADVLVLADRLEELKSARDVASSSERFTVELHLLHALHRAQERRHVLVAEVFCVQTLCLVLRELVPTEERADFVELVLHARSVAINTASVPFVRGKAR